MIHAYAAAEPRASFKPFQFDPGPLKDDEIEIKVVSCGICHSDLSMRDNEWGMTKYPFVGGHEVVGTIAAAGPNVKHLKVGQTVGLGWSSRSCLTCEQCQQGDLNLCSTGEGVIVGRHGGFADRVRCQARWALPIPAGVDLATAGPLFCGGITVYNPFVQFDLKPWQRVGVVGIGGLGHMALQFANAWGCEVTAFSSSPDKAEEARRMGAHNVVSSRDAGSLQKIAGSLDFILVTANVTLDWPAYIAALKPKGRLHVVGAVLEPIPVAAFSLLVGQKSVSGTPLGSPATTAHMLDFCARHKIKPMCETYPMAKINDAMERLASGKARYRIVLTA